VKAGEYWKLTILPGEWPSDLGRCNYDTLSPKRSSDAVVKDRGSADEAVVVVKPLADESVETRLRLKLAVSGRTPRRRAEHVSEFFFTADGREVSHRNARCTNVVRILFDLVCGPMKLPCNREVK